MARLLLRLAAWLFLGAPAASLPEAAEDFSLVGADGRDVLAEAAAHDVPTEWYRPSGSVLELRFRSHNRTFSHRLHRQSVPRSGGSVVVHGRGGRRQRALRQPLVFRSPSRDAVLTTVGRSFTGTVWVGEAIFDIRHRHGSAALEVTRHSAEPPVEVGSLRPSGPPKEPAGGRHLSTWSGSFAPDELDRWEDCYTDDHVMRTFRFGAIISSNVWSAESFQSDEEAEDWVQAMVANANNAFEPQLNVHLQLGSLFVQTSHTGAPSWDQGDSCPMLIHPQLVELSRWTPPDTSMGVWHVFDDCFVSGTIGLAWIGYLCDVIYNTADYGLVRLNTAVTWLSKNGAKPTWTTFAHEMGHNFGAQHSFELGQGQTGGIMDYGDGTIDGIYQFNELRKTEICQQINSTVSHCPAFSVFEAVCGNGVVEPGEDCECSDESQYCLGCCECQQRLVSGATERTLQCSPDAIGHGGCCSSEGLFAEVGAVCALGGEGGYCSEGACVINHVCRANSTLDGYCGLEAQGCRIKCTQAADDTCISLNGWEVNGHPINSLPDGTHCKESGIGGTCRDGDCKVKVAHRITDGVTTGAFTEPKPHSTATNFSGCVGFADSGFLGHADVDVFLRGKSLIQCNTECSSRQACHSFLHRADTGFCELWSKHKWREDLAVVPGYETYICDAFAAGFDFLDAIRREDTDIVAPAVPALNHSADSGHTRSTCYQACITDPDCHAFVHVEWTGSCQLYPSEVSGHDLVPRDPSEGYATFLLPCHGRGQICPCRESNIERLRAPCQCNSASSPLENECGINQYCYDGVCADAPKRRLSEDFCATSTSTTGTSSATRSSTSATSSTTATTTTGTSTTRSSTSATSSSTVTSTSASSTTRSSTSATSSTTVTSTSASSTTRSSTSATSSTTVTSMSASSTTRSSTSATSSTTVTSTSASSTTRSSTSTTRTTTVTSMSTSSTTRTSTTSATSSSGSSTTTYSSTSVSSSTSRSSSSSTTITITTTSTHTTTSATTRTTLTSTATSSSTVTSTSSEHTTTIISTTTTGHTTTMTSTSLSSTSDSSSTSKTGTSSTTRSSSATSTSASSTTRSSTSATSSTTVTSTSASSTTRSSTSATSSTSVTSTSASSTTRSSTSATSSSTVTSTSASSTTRSSTSATSSTTVTTTTGTSTTRSSTSATSSSSVTLTSTSSISTSRTSSTTQSSATSSSTTFTSRTTIQSNTPKVIGAIVIQFADPDAVRSSPEAQTEVLDSIRLTISQAVDVDVSYVSIWFVWSRRLNAAKRKRKLSGSFFTVAYSIDVPADGNSDAADVTDVEAALDSVDASSFTSQLQANLDSRAGEGAYSAEVLAITTTVVNVSGTTPLAGSDEAGMSSTVIIMLIIVGLGCAVGCQFPVMALCWRQQRRRELRQEVHTPRGGAVSPAELPELPEVDEDPVVPPSVPCRLILRGATGGRALVEADYGEVHSPTVHPGPELACCR